jgi:hypothetical protein
MPRNDTPKDRQDRVGELLNHPSYKRADLDLDLIASPELRSVRLLLEYVKPQMILRDHRVLTSIVLFGGARIVEPTSARARLDAARAEARATPNDPQLSTKVKMAERVVERSRYYDVARDFARIVTEEFQDQQGPRFVIVT